MKKVKLSIMAVLLSVIMVFAAACVLLNDLPGRPQPEPRPPGGGDIDLGAPRSELTGQQSLELLAGWLATVEDGITGGFTVTMVMGNTTGTFVTDGDNAIESFIASAGQMGTQVTAESNIYWYDGEVYSREKLTEGNQVVKHERFVVLEKLEYIVFDVLAGDFVELWNEDFDVKGTDYDNGYRVEVEFETLNPSGSSKVEINIIYAFDNQGLLLGSTTTLPPEFVAVSGSRYVARSIDWEMPTLEFPNDFDEFLRPDQIELIYDLDLHDIAVGQWVDIRAMVTNDGQYHWSWRDATFEVDSQADLYMTHGSVKSL